MDRARRPTLGFFSQNLHATHTNLAKSSGGPYVAAELRGDGPAVEHLATGTEAVNRRIARRGASVRSGMERETGHLPVEKNMENTWKVKKLISMDLQGNGTICKRLLDEFQNVRRHTTYTR